MKNQFELHEIEVPFLPDETVSFNPSSKIEMDGLLSRLGPEALYLIGNELMKIAIKDMESGLLESSEQS